MKNNAFYTCTSAFLFIYDTKEAALNGYNVVGSGVFSEEQAQSAVKAWTNDYNCLIVGYVKMNEPIFLIDSFNNIDEDGNDFSYHHVIVGEKVGWILNERWCTFRPLERVAND